MKRGLCTTSTWEREAKSWRWLWADATSVKCLGKFSILWNPAVNLNLWVLSKSLWKNWWLLIEQIEKPHKKFVRPVEWGREEDGLSNTYRWGWGDFRVHWADSIWPYFATEEQSCFISQRLNKAAELDESTVLLSKEFIMSQKISETKNNLCIFSIIASLSAIYMNTVFHRYNLLFTTWYILHKEDLMQIFPFHVKRRYYIYP